MEAVAHNPTFAKKVGIPQSVGRDFSTADKDRKFSKGGDTMATKKMMGESGKESREEQMMDKSQDKKMITKAFKQHDTQEHKGGVGTKLALKKGGMPKFAKGGFTSAADGVAQRGKTQATQIKMARGGRCK